MTEQLSRLVMTEASSSLATQKTDRATVATTHSPQGSPPNDPSMATSGSLQQWPTISHLAARSKGAASTSWVAPAQPI
ncbi:MAG: hypothetical protein M3290_04490, partial [Actinomycetota bacterium]|nr:hypothetical protein [Actinomycetota bacterium]